jgi:DNA-binding NarL/FixJ family response regulator
VTLIRILIVDDHPAICKGLIATMAPEPDMTVVGVGSTREDAVRLFREHQPDITLMDLGLRDDVDGIDAIREIRTHFPAAKIIVFSALRGDEDVYQALRAGAVTFLSKETPDEQLMTVIREVYAGNRPIPQDVARKLADRLTLSALTDRETQVLKLIAEGFRNKEIAAELHISEETVQGHVKKILKKLNVSDRTKAAMVAAQRGIFHISRDKDRNT